MKYVKITFKIIDADYEQLENLAKKLSTPTKHKNSPGILSQKIKEALRQDPECQVVPLYMSVSISHSSFKR